MTQETPPENSTAYSNERAVAWARQAIARKRAEQKRMQEEFDKNYKLQAALAKLREEENAKSRNSPNPV